VADRAQPGTWISLAYLAVRLLAGSPGAGDPPGSAHRGGAACPPGAAFCTASGRSHPAVRAGGPGAWVGLDCPKTRGDLARAVLESVAFRVRGFLERPSSYSRTLYRVTCGDRRWRRRCPLEPNQGLSLGLPYVRLKRESSAAGGPPWWQRQRRAVDDLAATALTTTAEAGRIMPDPPCSRFTTGEGVSGRHRLLVPPHMRCTHEKSFQLAVSPGRVGWCMHAMPPGRSRY